MKKILAALVVAALLAGAAVTAEAAPSKGSGATLWVSTGDGARVTSTVASESRLVFSGCGYAANTGVTVVVVSPTATSFFGGPADATGCFSTAGYYANDAGSYSARSYQSSSKRSLASVTFSVNN